MDSKLEIMAIPRRIGTISEWLNTTMGPFQKVTSQREKTEFALNGDGKATVVKLEAMEGGGSSLNFN